MSKRTFAHFQGHGFNVDLKQLSAEDISYLIDLLVEEMAVRIEQRLKTLDEKELHND